MASLNQSQIDALVGHGYGKGTLSRNAPNFQERSASGIIGASKSDPFATPTRFASSSANTPPSPAKLISNVSDSYLASDVVEAFQFSREEALYLVEKFGAISVSSTIHSSSFDSLSLLKMFSNDQYNFIYRYYGTDYSLNKGNSKTWVLTRFCFLVYQYYRNQGWVVKLGAKNGVDFLLYSLGGPTNAHAQYGVKIQIQCDDSSEPHCVPWQVSTRVLDTVAKSLLICLVKPDQSATLTEDPESQFDFSSWSLEELSVCRWDVNISTRV